MSLLQIISDVCDDVGVDAPISVIGNTDQDIKQLLQLANTEGKLLADSYDWQALETEFSLTTTGTEDQGAIATLLPGYKKLIPNTLWNQNIRYMVAGNTSPQDYQRIKTAVQTGPYPDFRIRGGRFLLYPIAASGQTIKGEYITKNWVLNVDGVTPYSRWTNDTDTSVLDEDIITLGVRWRWLKAHNFDYAEEFRDYETIKENSKARDGGKLTKNLAGRQYPDGPFIPQFKDSYWNLS